ncbi:MAG TPA: Holliday junction branch migration DNA helicase RuvB [Spirochaetia bacterium]|nr:MAG: Holliday junction DNA helicase RuvB [Spirochaetes bacterium GWB1_36_13]HCL57076.1 Holliday junction branch migration DNA helicase RuvB [Spirochaetia bacterium]
MNEIFQTEEESELEKNLLLRPESFENFIGQNRNIDNLKVFIQAAKMRKQVLDHVLLSGSPGLGKTTLARIIANEMKGELVATSAPALEKTGDLAAVLTGLEKGSILFIDEIHRLRPALEELLYSAMEDFKIDIMIGQGAGAKTVELNLNPFTLIGATTRAGMLSTPLQTRFGIQLRLEFYEPEDLEKILAKKAEVLKIKIAENSKNEISKRSRGTPRILLKLLKRVWDFSMVAGQKEIDIHITRKALERMGIDENGLSLEDKKILEIIVKNYDGGPVGLQTIAISMGESEDGIQDVYEPFLIREGFIKKTPKGRMTTAKAYEYLGYSKNQESLF